MIRHIYIICILLILPTLGLSVQISPESNSVEAGLLNMNDSIVLRFDRPVNDVDMTSFISVKLTSGDQLPASVMVSGTSIVIRSQAEWPANKTVILNINSNLPISGRAYSGPTTLTFHVQGDAWDRLENAYHKSDKRTVKSDGYLENGVEVYPLPFTPNGDGVNDELHIARPGIGFRNPYIRIFSPDGIRVMSIARSGLSNGEVIWDGVDRLGHETRPGPYFIIVEEDLEIIASGVIYILR